MAGPRWPKRHSTTWQAQMQQESLRGPRGCSAYPPRGTGIGIPLRLRARPSAPQRLPPRAGANSSRRPGTRGAQARGRPCPEREVEALRGAGNGGAVPLGSFLFLSVPLGFILPEGPHFAPQPCGSALRLRFWGVAPQNELHRSVAVPMGCPGFILRVEN